ncbi:MAG: RHS repeat-associated core domain-containing protein, partial [Planctomycetia bacterium]
TVETRSDGAQIIVYTNFAGEPILRELKSGANRWIMFYERDQYGRIVRQAYPSAVVGYDDAQENLAVQLRTSDGLLREYEYYHPVVGTRTGRLKSESVRRGVGGVPSKLRDYEYGSSSLSTNRRVEPTSLMVEYRNDDGGGALQTIYEYTYHPDSLRVQEKKTYRPQVLEAENGNGISYVRREAYDVFGNLTWAMNERGVITAFKYNVVTGATTRRIDDVDTSLVSGAPSGWATVFGFGRHLVTDFTSDDKGRITQKLGPAHEVDLAGTATTVRTAEWTVYKDSAHEVWHGRGYATGAAGSEVYTLVNPVQITKMDDLGRVVDQIAATRSSTSGRLTAADAFPQSSWVRWNAQHYNDHCQRDWSRAYHDVPASGVGTPTANYDQTDFGYDALGRTNRVRTPGGTITRTVYDPRGLATAVYVGLDDAGATDFDPTGGGAVGNDMVLTEAREYDGNAAGGDGYLTNRRQPVDATPANDRVTTFGYDYRGRRIWTDGEVDFYEETVYDNLGRAVRVDRRDTTSTGNLAARTETKYDSLGRVFRVLLYSVDPATGAVGNAIADDFWYDGAGNRIKEIAKGKTSYVKRRFDGLNRVVKEFVCYGADANYAAAGSVTANTVLEQTETTYDDGGSVVRNVVRRRLPAATGMGELTTPTGAQPKARVSYKAMWSDAVGRMQAAADYGTNGGASWTRPALVPTRSDEVLVTSQLYNDRGEGFSIVDPAGMETRAAFDDLGRRTTQIVNWKSSPSTPDENITTTFSYTPDSLLKALTAANAATGAQITEYIYGTTLTDSTVARADLLRAEVYPDSVDGSDRVVFSYNRQSQRKTQTDQRGVVRAFDYDKLGRLIHDRVTTLPSGVGGAVRRISTEYDVRGVVALLTSWSDATVGQGAVVNQVKSSYN